MPFPRRALMTADWAHGCGRIPRGRARLVVAVLAAGLLAACSPRGELVVLPLAETPGTVVDILSATTRGPEEGTELGARARAETLRFGDFRISVPPERSRSTTRSGSPP